MIDLQFATLGAAAIVPIIVAVTQAIKMVARGDALNRWSPLISIALGIIFSFFAASETIVYSGQTLLNGVMYGLAASGLYSGVKSTAHSEKNDSIL